MASGSRQLLARSGLVFGAFSLLTIAATWPAAGHFSSHVAGLPYRDSLQYTWSLWWASYAWDHGGTPGTASLINYPWAVQHPLLDATAGLELMAWPLQHLLTATQVYNLIFLASFPLCGTAVYLLASDLVASPLAAFAAGALYAFSAHRFGQALAGHLPMLVTWWLPLFILFGRRCVEAGRRSDAALAGLFLGLSLQVGLVVTAYVVIPAAAICAACALVARRRKQSRPLWVQAALTAGIAVVIAAPTYLPFLTTSVRANVSFRASESASSHSTDLAALFAPSRFHPLWSRIPDVSQVLSRLMSEVDDVERAAYLGWICLALAAVALIRQRRAAAPWVALTIVPLLLSMGPSLQLGGRETGVAMPYAALMRLPFMDWGRTPERYGNVASLGMALLASLGLDRLRNKPVVAAAIVCLALLDHCAMWPLPAGTSLPPAVVQARASLPGAVLHVPATKRQVANTAMYYQTENARPIIGGYIHRNLPGMRAYTKAMDALLTSQGEGADRPATALERAGVLSGLGIGEIWLHREWSSPLWVDAAASRLQEAIGAPVADLGDALLYEVRPLPAEATPAIAQWPMFSLLSVAADPLEARAGSVVTVTTRWRALQRSPRELTLFVHLLTSDGERVSQNDGQPLGGNWPATLWAPGSRVVDQRDVALPADLPAGHYSLAIGWYESVTQEPLLTTSEDESGQRAVLVRTPVIGVSPSEPTPRP